MATSLPTSRRAFSTAHAFLIAAVMALSLSSVATAGHARNKPQTDTVDFAKLAQHRPRPCPPDGEAVAGPAGWKQAPAMCVWQGRLQMRRWHATTAADLCVARPASWLAWQRPRIGVAPAAPGAAWHSSWKSHFVSGAAEGEMQRIATVEMRAPGVWTATEWTWSPSPRAATRRWQQGRWTLITQAASKLRAGPTSPPTPLRNAWEQNLNGRPGEITSDS